MTPAILADAANRERLRCVGCRRMPPPEMPTAWGESTSWICSACVPKLINSPGFIYRDVRALPREWPKVVKRPPKVVG